MHPFLKKYASKVLSALACAAAIAIAGCHGQGNISYYGIAWVDVTDEPGDYTSYVITIDSITLTRTDGYVAEAVGTPEIVDLTQVHNIAELWSSGSIPDGTYTSATITVDYTPVASSGSSVISVMVNGKPQAANVLDAYTGDAPSTYSINIQFDPDNLPTITPTFASTSAVLLTVDFDLAASGTVDLSTSPATVRIRPYVSIGMQAPNNKLIRVRGPLINSSIDVNTFTVYIRPFYDEANNIGSLTLFSQPNTVYTLNGKGYVGNGGLQALSVLSAGTTTAAGFTTFQTDYNASNGATAGRFNLVYVVAGSTLEDVYTEGVSGDVIARNGNTVTLEGSTLFLNTADEFFFCGVADTSSLCTAGTQVLLGPGTIVTADNNSTLTPSTLNSSSVSVGQHITARGVCVNNCIGPTVVLDATGTSSTNTGSVRLQNTEVWGTLVNSATGNLEINAQTINNYPIADFDFAGNGSGTENPAAFLIDTGSIPLPAGSAAGDPLWVSGYTTPFGSAPPDFNAVAVNSETSVQIAGGQVGGGSSTTPGSKGCGIGSQVCDPAILEVTWNAANTTPFSNLSNSGFSLNLADGSSGVVRIGPELIDLSTLAQATLVVPTTLTVTSTFAPRFTVGDPKTATITPTVTTASTYLQSFSAFADWVSKVNSTLTSAVPAVQMTASGIYDRASNTFTATSIDLVL
ncbi:MAG TPA: DUF4382 domain-containing protein [Steroidobacteraceae bacterium]|nr:DUF4382 domain-containing protein [Steroidobacteraceae bacterium]